MGLHWLLQIPVLFLGVIVHECAHGLAALRAGDPTAKLEGRITLNPVPHIDPVWTIMLPAILILSHSSFIIGGAKPVPVNPYNYRNPRRDDIMVSLAGPFSNLALALAFAVILGLFGRLLSVGVVPGGINTAIILLLQYGVMINVWLAVFNLIPIPPLDGSHVLEQVLPPGLSRVYESIRPFGFIILIVLLVSPLFVLFYIPANLLISFFLGISRLLF